MVGHGSQLQPIVSGKPLVQCARVPLQALHFT